MIPTTNRPEAAERLIHVVDDYEDYRDSLIYALLSKGYEARGYASGEAFLAEYRWDTRGVVTLDIDFEPPGAMNGLQIFNRLIELRCPMPVIFLTGPHGNDVRMAVEQVTRRRDVDFYSKQASLDALIAAIDRFLAREPEVRAEAEEERRVLQVVLAEWTAAEREVMARVYKGQTNYGIARELNKEEGVVETQRASAMKKLLGDSRSPQHLVETLKPALDKLNAPDVEDLAQMEGLARLRLLDELTFRVLEATLEGRSEAQIARQLGIFDETDRERRYRETIRQALDRGLALLQADAPKNVKKWLTWVQERAGAADLAALRGAQS